jgi:type III secretory pathway component EscS
MTEHWSLLGARSLVYTEAMSRTSIFVASLAGSVVALALVSQATDFGDGFIAFALVLLPVVYFLGVVTVVRLSQVNWEDARWTQGMNRIRNAYLELEPELEPYFVTSRYDDDLGILRSSIAMNDWPPRTQAFVAAPGVVAVMSSVVAGAAAGIAAIGLDLGTAAALALGGVLFVASLGGFAAWAQRRIARSRTELDVLFPTPSDDAG